MADIDEDVMPRNGPEAGEIDLSDETQDFRFLSIVSKDDAKIPKRGEKDFEPHATALQSQTLAASRAAMHDALSFNRVHAPKKHILAVYDPVSNMAYTDAPRSTLFKSTGRVKPARETGLVDPVSSHRLWLLPEEAIYLLERGTIDIRWPAPAQDSSDHVGLPMSLQGAYAAFIGTAEAHGDVLTFEKYSVYAALKRLGYAVHRADTWNAPAKPATPNSFPTLPGTWQHLGLSLASGRAWFISHFTTSTSPLGSCLLSDKCFRSFSDIYRSLALIPYYDPTSSRLDSTRQPNEPEKPLRITYNVYKPNNTVYKKSAPGPADFNIVVVDGRTTSVPSLAQLNSLLHTLPYEPPKDNVQVYQRIRNGHKSIILAVVDQGVTNYIRFADAAFGQQKLYDRVGPANKGKGPTANNSRPTGVVK